MGGIILDKMKYFCNKCDREIFEIDMNDIELDELQREGSFVCSNCINEEMDNLK